MDQSTITLCTEMEGGHIDISSVWSPGRSIQPVDEWTEICQGLIVIDYPLGIGSSDVMDSESHCRKTKYQRQSAEYLVEFKTPFSSVESWRSPPATKVILSYISVFGYMLHSHR